jgi:hypothetical protein
MQNSHIWSVTEPIFYGFFFAVFNLTDFFLAALFAGF